MSKVSSIQILTPLQEGVLYHSLMGDSTSYFEQYTFTIHEEIEEQYFRKALSYLFYSHDVLRTRLVADKGARPVQAILNSVEPELIVFNWTDLCEQDFETRLTDYIKKDRERSFDLQSDVLLRATLVQGKRHAKIILSFHHIILDGWSFAIVLKDLFLSYHAFKNDQEPTKTSGVSFINYLKWLNSNKENSQDFWNKQLNITDDFEIADFFTIARSNNKSQQVSEQISLGKDLTRNITEVASQLKVSVNSVIYAIWGIILARYNQRKHVVTGITVSGRNVPLDGAMNIVGLCINTIPFAFHIDEEIPAKDYIKKVSDDFIEGIPYHHHSLADIQSAVNVPTGLFNHIIAIEDYPYDDISENTELSTLDLSGLEVFEETHYPFSVHVSVGNDIKWRIAYDPDVYDSTMVVQVVEHISFVASQIVDGVNRNNTLSAIRLLDDKTKEIILNEFNDTRGYYPSQETLLSLYQSRLEETPNELLLHDIENSFSIVDIELHSNKLSSLLSEAGIGKGDSVAVCIDRSVWSMVVIIACFKQGAVYVPIDSTLPSDRLNYILSDSSTKVVVTTSDVKSTFLNTSLQILTVDDMPANVVDSQTNISLSPSDTAYIIYTSGSTGNPKGVMVTHTSVVNRIYWMQEAFPLTANDKILQKTPVTFDVSVWELFHWLFSGCQTYFLENGKEKDPHEIEDVIKQQGITVLHFVPSMLSVFIDYVEERIESLCSVRYIFSSGEELPLSTVIKFNNTIYTKNNAVLVNLYGPTEATVDCAGFVCSPLNESYRYIPIGKPLLNYRGYVLNEQLALLPPWIPGELYIGGVGVAKGYINKPELTENSFSSDSFVDGEQMYKTGDAAMFNNNGELIYLGRLDNQVKLNGQRIECGEIEAAINKISKVAQSAVLLHKGSYGDILIAFYTGKQIDTNNIVKDISGVLPKHMIPAKYYWLEEMPVLSSGKIDRKTLKNFVADDSVSPNILSYLQNDATQLQLLQLWESIIGDKIDVSKDFFANGGHSLKAIRLLAGIRKTFGVSVSLQDLFLYPSLNKLAQYIKSLDAESYLQITKAPGREYYPLMPAQESLYIMQQLPNIGATYQVPAIIRLDEPVDKERLSNAIKKLIVLHAILRTSFISNDEAVFQKVEEIEKVQKRFEENGGLQHIYTEDNEIDWWQQKRQVIDINKAPLFRAYLLESEKKKSYLVLDVHHLITDEHSNNLFAGDLLTLYQDKGIKDNTLQYHDVAYWYDKTYLKSEKYKLDAKWWNDYLTDRTDMLDLSDGKRTQQLSFNGFLTEKKLSEDTCKRINDIAAKLSVTPFTVIMSAFSIVFSRYTLQDEYLVGIPFSIRQSEELNYVTGMLVNTLPFRFKVDHYSNFNEYVSTIGKDMVSVLQHNSYPLTHIIRNLHLERSGSSHVLFSVLFNYISQEQELGEENTTTIESKFDFSVEVKEYKGDYMLSFSYSSNLFDEEYAQQLFEHFNELIANATRHPEEQIGKLDIVTKQEKEHLLKFGSGKKQQYPYKTLQQILHNSYKLYANEVAFKDIDSTLTYAELKQLSDSIANDILKSRHVSKDDVVAVLMERSVIALATVHAIVRLGAAYLPLDPSFPEERLHFMIEDSEAVIVVVTEDTTLQLAIPYVKVTGENKPVSVSYPEVDSDAAAYVIYTSGSTGKPKGVTVENRSIANRLCWMQGNHASDTTDTWLWKTAFTFDVSLGELFGWTLGGSSIAILNNGQEKDPEIIINAIARHSVTRVHFVATMLQVFLEYIEAFDKKVVIDTLSLIMTSGEVVSPELVKFYYSVIDNTPLLIGYGPTEATVEVSETIASEETTFATIGKPFDNVNLYVVHPACYALQPFNIKGDLIIEGIQVARGYINRPVVQHKVFKQSPFTEGERVYNSGDIVSFTKNGLLKFSGRSDRQVKHNGYRIELDEIEKVIEQYPSIVKCSCIIIRDGHKNNLVAFYKTNSVIDQESLSKQISKVLPAYSIPELFCLNDFPQNANGKTDTKQLSLLYEQNDGVNTTAVVTTETEQYVLSIFEEILNSSRLNVSDDFFTNGGHSILAIKLINKIQKRLSVKLSLADVFQHSTVERLASFIQSNKRTDSEEIPYLGKLPHYNVAPAQRRLWFLQSMQPESVAYNMTYSFRIEENYNNDILTSCIQELIAKHDQLRASFTLRDEQLLTILHNDISGSDYLKVLQARDNGQARVLINEFANLPFSLDKAPLFRVLVVELSDGFYITLCMHHIITDGWSMSMLLDELKFLYNARSAGAYHKKTVEKRLRYVDVADWISKKITGDKDGTKEYWCNKLTLVPSPGVLPLADIIKELSYEGSTLHFKIDNDIAQLITEKAHELKCSEYQLMLFGFSMLIAKLSGNKHIIFGSSVAGRNHPATENIFGFFVNMLPVIVAIDDNLKIRKALVAFSKGIVEDMEYESLPFDELNSLVKEEKNINLSDLIKTRFVYNNFSTNKELERENLRIEEVETEVHGSKFDVSFTVQPFDNGYTLNVEYRNDRYDEATVKYYVQQWQEILKAIYESKQEDEVSSLLKKKVDPSKMKSNSLQLLKSIKSTPKS